MPSATEPVATSVPLAMKIHQKELGGVEEGRLTSLWLTMAVFLFMLYGCYTWGVYPIKK